MSQNITEAPSTTEKLIPRLIIFNKYCKLQNEFDIEMIRRLDEELSYTPAGAFFLKNVRGYMSRDGKWVQNSPKKSLLTNKLEFPRGLLNRVIRLYDNADKKLEVIDKTDIVIINKPLDISKKLEEIGKIPREHQIRALEVTNSNNFGVLQLSVGAGKTLLANLIAANKNVTASIFVIGITLLDQFYELSCQIFGEDRVGYIGNGICKISEINIISIWTAGAALSLKKTIDNYEDKEKKLDKEKYHEIRSLLARTKLAILDESHIAKSDTINEIYKALTTVDYFYSMSGSPYRGSEEDIITESICGPTLIQVSSSELIQKNLLVAPTIKFISVNSPEPSGTSYQTIYKECIVENEIRNQYILRCCKSLYSSGYKILILFSNISHGDILFNMISKEVPCALLSGKDDSEQRKKVLKQLENGEIGVILSSKIFEIGLDAPFINAGIFAGGGKSLISCLQKIGRYIRQHPKKNRVQIIDFADQNSLLLKHAKERKKHYKSESEFIVEWPKNNKGNK